MSWIVVKPHISNYPNPIHFKVGDFVKVGKTDPDFPGWIWVTTIDGNQGWAPIQFIHVDEASEYATAIKEYSAQELNTKIGEQVFLHYELNGWGWAENENQCTGWVPMRSIQLVDEKLSHIGENMKVISKQYVHEKDYQKISEFLIKHYLPRNADGNWLEPTWEYANFHPALDEEHIDRWRIWELDNEIVGFAHYESWLGEGFFEFHPDFRYLRTEMLAYAEDNLLGTSRKDGRKFLCAYVNDYDQAMLELVQQRGYQRATGDTRPFYRFEISDPFPEIKLPDGFHLTSLVEDCDWEKVHRVMWRGFNHPGEPPGGEEELLSRQKMFDTPKARRDLKIAVKAPNGNFVAFCGMFYEDHNRFAYVEPVATDPDYRRLGLGKAAVLEGIRRCAELGAKEAFVGSDQLFYQSIGFQKVFNTEGWIKYFD